MKVKLYSLLLALTLSILLITLTTQVYAAPKSQDNLECIPPSIMLHPKDSWVLKNVIIPYLVKNNYTTITYLDYQNYLDGVASLPPKPVIISIDDIHTIYIGQSWKQIHQDLKDNQMVAVLGVTAKIAPEKDQTNYDILKTWSQEGFELANHTIFHSYLAGSSSSWLDFEIGNTNQRIFDGTSFMPITLILPYGGVTIGSSKTHDQKIYDAAQKYDLKFIVGISGGRQINRSSLTYPLYLGRIASNYTYQLEHWCQP